MLRLGLSSFEELDAYEANEASVSGETHAASVSGGPPLDPPLDSVSVTESALNEFLALGPGESFDFPSPSGLSWAAQGADDGTPQAPRGN